jgi:hypothetical protein
MFIWFLQFVIGGVIGFCFAKFTSGKREGVQGRIPSLKFTIGQYTIFLHHWIFSAMAIITLLLLEIKYLWLYGILFGAMIQGLLYKDFYYIIFKTNKYPFK